MTRLRAQVGSCGLLSAIRDQGQLLLSEGARFGRSCGASICATVPKLVGPPCIVGLGRLGAERLGAEGIGDVRAPTTNPVSTRRVADLIALIPARGGSKGLPGKNIKLLAGKPLIAYTIAAASAARSISRVIVSTDSQDIADVAVAYGAEVPFLRPPHLATDESLAIDTFIDTIVRLGELNDTRIREFVVLQPTSPLRTAQDIDDAVDIFLSCRADSVISYVRSPHSVRWYCRIDDDGIVRPLFSHPDKLQNRQSESASYLPNGAVYVLRSDLLIASRSYHCERTFPYVMPAERSVDIDTELDFAFAEFLLLTHNVNASLTDTSAGLEKL